MADIIGALANTPLPTLLAVIGFVMLSIGFGLRVRVVFDVDRLNKTYAKVVGFVLLVFGLIPYGFSLLPDISAQPTQTSDPFLIYYLITVPLVVGLYWAALKFTGGQAQVRAAKTSFALVGALVTIVVLWRATDVFFYISAPGQNSVPLGLHQQSNFVPYFVLIGTAVLVTFWAICANTKEPPNSENRMPIVRYFVLSCIYMATCRLAWEVIDYAAKASVPPP